MLDNRGFDLWADEYDRTVQVSEGNNSYPFAGYKEILSMVYNEVMKKEQSHVLDIGFGTGVLTNKLYEHGHHIDGLDFSPKMIAIAQDKMPQANLMEWDISKGLPEQLKEKEYDIVLSTYTLHHLTDEDKVELVKNLLLLLSKHGKIVIGDVAFQTREKLEICRKASSPYWDSDEFYFVFDEFQALLIDFCSCEFYPVSHCGGVILISN